MICQPFQHVVLLELQEVVLEVVLAKLGQWDRGLVEHTSISTEKICSQANKNGSF